MAFNSKLKSVLHVMYILLHRDKNLPKRIKKMNNEAGDVAQWSRDCLTYATPLFGFLALQINE